MKKVLFIFIIYLSSVIFASWTSPVLIDNTEDLRGTGYDSVDKITRDGSGNIFVTYRKKYNDGYGNVYQNYVSYSIDNGATWSILGDENGTGPLQVVGRGPGNEGYNQRVGSLCIDNKGIIHFVWYGKDKNNTGLNERQIKYSQFDNGDWSTWKNIASISGYVNSDYWQEHPYISVGQTGLYVVWESLDSNNNYDQIKIAKSLDNGNSWALFQNGKSYNCITGNGADNSTNVGLKDRTQSRPFILPIYSSTLGRDILYVFWYGGNSGTQQQIKLSYSKDGGDTWSAYYNLGQQDLGLNGYVQKSFDVAADMSGNLYVVWSGLDSASAYYRLKYSWGMDTNHNGFIEKNEWTHWSNIVSPQIASDHQEHPSIAIDKHTNIHLVFQEADQFGRDIVNVSQADVYYIMLNKNSHWTNEQKLSSSKNINIYPYLRWSNNYMNAGSLDVVWLAGNSKNDSSFDILYSFNSSYTMQQGAGASVSFEIYKSDEDLGVTEGQATVYPNPVDFGVDESAKFIVSPWKGTVIKKTLYVFDLMGNLVYRQSIDKDYLLSKPFEWKGINLDGKSISNGLYLYRIFLEYSKGRVEKTKTYKIFVK